MNGMNGMNGTSAGVASPTTRRFARHVATVASLVLIVPAAAHGSVIDFTVDPSQSSMTVGLLGASDTSSVSGAGMIELDPPTEPFDTAQFTDFLLQLDDGFELSLLAGLVQVTADPGSVTVDLLEPGPPGYLEGGEFAQLGNLVQLGGVVEVVDPLGLFIGTQDIDLASYGPVILDILSSTVDVVGDAVTVSIAVDSAVEVSPGVMLLVGGTIVAHGTIPPCAEDLDGDGTVGVSDLLTVLAAWGGSGGDVTGDGATDVADLLAVLSAWGAC